MVTRFAVLGATLASLAACGGSSGCIGGPGEVAFGGLRYDVCPGVSDFVGLDQTDPTAMPATGGDVTYTGVLRGNVNGTYRDGTAQVVADFVTPEATVSGNIDFNGASGVGIVDFTETVPITGSSFGNSGAGGSRTNINGAFYGDNAEVAAGTVIIDGLGSSGGNIMIGRFITTQDP